MGLKGQGMCIVVGEPGFGGRFKTSAGIPLGSVELSLICNGADNGDRLGVRSKVS